MPLSANTQNFMETRCAMVMGTRTRSSDAVMLKGPASEGPFLSLFFAQAVSSCTGAEGAFSLKEVMPFSRAVVVV
jgi:hypothetical protein